MRFDIVQDAGFAALEAGNADEAVAVSESFSYIDLVLTTSTCPEHGRIETWLARFAIVGGGSKSLWFLAKFARPKKICR